MKQILESDAVETLGHHPGTTYSPRRSGDHPFRAVILLALVLALTLGTPVATQPTTDETAIDALQCWRRVSQPAVFVGQRFTMTVTCQAVDTSRATTLPNEAALEPQTIDVAPFEVLEGEQYDSVRTGPYRFFQYRYTLRLITESNFGLDLEIPAIELPYRIERRLDDAPALLGRELTYILPPEPVRILSLVPQAIVDIRDLPPATLGAADRRNFRASLLTFLATLFGLAAMSVVAVGCVRLAHARTSGTIRPATRLPLPLVAHRVLRELTKLRAETANQGWTVEFTERALSAIRVAGSVALAEPVAQSSVPDGIPARTGQLTIRYGILRPQTAAISSGLTATTLLRRLALAQSGSVRIDEGAIIDLSEALAIFTAARYRRPNGPIAEPQALQLVQALESSLKRVQRLRWESSSIVRRTTNLLASARTWWTRTRVTWLR